MVTSVVNYYKWSPKEIGDLFIDAEDYLGLEFWYNEVVRMVKELPKPPDK